MSVPKSQKAAFAEIKKIIDMGWIDIPTDKEFNGNAAPGDFLEYLLGGQRNNRDSPDLLDWEVKFHGGTALLTLFHKDPEPRGVLRQFIHEHGWDDGQGRISFRHTLGGESERGFYVANENNRIIVRHRTKDNTNVPHWEHDTLLNAGGAKLRRLILVSGTYDKHRRRVKYESAIGYWDFQLTNLFRSMESGIVKIDFDARTKGGPGTAIRNHGTKFRINPKDLGALYRYHQKIT